jgi:hypothetical protein
MTKDFSPHIFEVCERIRALVNPHRIILFGHKTNIAGQTSSFKLCVITDEEDRQEVERKIYLEVDSEVPFDVVVYTVGEWKTMSAIKGSFANRVAQSGSVIYG